MRPEYYSRIWAWSESCSLASNAATMFQVKEAYSVADSQAGVGAFSLQLNLQTDDERIVQNVLQFYPSYVMWQLVLSDENGVLPNVVSPSFGGAFSMERLPAVWPTALDVGDAVNLGFSTDAVGKLVGILLLEGRAFLQVSKAPFATYQTKGFKSVNPAIVGAGNASVATFGSGSFEILSSLNNIGDLVYDGQGYPLFLKPQPPTICGRQPPATNENANLKYQVTEVSNANIRLVASP